MFRKEPFRPDMQKNRELVQLLIKELGTKSVDSLINYSTETIQFVVFAPSRDEVDVAMDSLRTLFEGKVDCRITTPGWNTPQCHMFLSPEGVEQCIAKLSLPPAQGISGK
jgi:hypothetical protein